MTTHRALKVVASRIGLRSGFVRVIGIISLVTGHSLGATPGSAEDFKYPLAVVSADKGPIYIADRNLPGIWRAVDGKMELYFQGSKKFRTPLNAVRCLAIDRQGRLLAGDSSTRNVYRFDDSGKPMPLATNETGIGKPMGIAVDSQGSLFVSDSETHRIWKVPAEGGKPTEFAQINAPRGLTIDAEDRLWIVSHGKNQLVRVSPAGKVDVVVKGRPFKFSHHVVLDSKNVAYVSDGYAKAIWKVDASGKPEQWVSGKPLINPVGLARRGETLLVADPHAKAIFALSPDGTLKQLLPAK